MGTLHRTEDPGSYGEGGGKCLQGRDAAAAAQAATCLGGTAAAAGTAEGVRHTAIGRRLKVTGCKECLTPRTPKIELTLAMLATAHVVTCG
jgi:hypothetical protein